MSGFVFLPKTPSSNSNTLSTVVSSPSPCAISAALPFKEPKMASFRSPSGQLGQTVFTSNIHCLYVFSLLPGRSSPLKKDSLGVLCTNCAPPPLLMDLDRLVLLHFWQQVLLNLLQKIDLIHLGGYSHWHTSTFHLQ